jgi:glutathione synthase/RimK-type ligase-like ATP-grasp enzyme
MALADAGFRVEALCPAGHPVTKTSAVRETIRYRPLLPLKSLDHAIEATDPDLVIPADDLAVRHLHALHRRDLQRGANGARSVLLIERSMGSPEGFPILYDRAACMRVAEEEGIRVPEIRVLHSVDDLKKWVGRIGLPTVLKANETSGGDGVRVVRTMKEAELAFQTLQAPPLIARAMKRALMDDNWALVSPSLLRHRSVVNAQKFVEGCEGTSVVACWEGTVLASLHFEVIKKRNAAGPATVVRLIDDDDMSDTARRIARRLKLSGIHGFDFMLAIRTRKPYLIEINPRATQLCHLTLGPGRDIPAALLGAISEKTVATSPKLTEHDTIALFPQEWIRDPKSSFLRSVYHDIPWQEPRLIEACIRNSRKQRDWYREEKSIGGRLD